MIVPYCERLLLAAEPVNTLSNIAFLLAGIAMLWQLGQGAPRPRAEQNWLRCLAALTMLIGAGSALFHAAPTKLTQALDIAPIALFSLLAVVLLLRVRCALPALRIAGIVLAWVVTTIVAAQWPEVMAGSLFYLPTLCLLFAIALLIGAPRQPVAACALTFLVALIARTVDIPLCGLAPFSLHALWHCLTALTCLLALRAITAPRT